MEFVVVGPVLLFLLMGLLQYGLLYHAKSQLNYTTFEAARAGTVANANSAYRRACAAPWLTRIDRERRRRTCVASIFPTPDECLCLISALRAELDDD